MTLASQNSYIRNPPTVIDGTATGTAALAFPTFNGADVYAVNRRWEIENTGAGTLTVCLVAKGSSLGALTVASGRRVAAGKTFSATTSGAIDVAVVGSSTYNGLLSDA